MPVPNSKFALGQSVICLSPGRIGIPVAGKFTVVRLLPWDAGGWHYHVESVLDRHVRRVHEGKIKAA